MKKKHIFKLILWSLIVPVILLLLLLSEAIKSRSLSELKAWHRVELTREMKAGDINSMELSDYLDGEDRLLSELEATICKSVPGTPENTYNRYTRNGPNNPLTFSRNWNRTFEMIPDEIKGGVLLIHGLTDSPYSVRAMAEVFRDSGLVALGLRMPGHGTIPSALKQAEWNDWAAAVRMGVRHIRRRCGKNSPFILVGYSSGGTLALNYTLDALKLTGQPVPDRLILVSPALGITPYAAIADWHHVLSFLPWFEKFQWQDVYPEFDPYKYNSFPKDSGYQEHRLIQRVQNGIRELVSAGDSASFPPMLTLQSVVDDTVTFSDLIQHLYIELNDPRHELVLFDINRQPEIHDLMGAAALNALSETIHIPGRQFRLTVITNARTQTNEIEEHVYADSSNSARINSLTMRWPSEMVSLSHVALPFEPSDPLYGMDCGDTPRADLNLGALAFLGERNVMIIPAKNRMRLRYNPFFSYIRQRLEKIAVPESREQDNDYSK